MLNNTLERLFAAASRNIFLVSGWRCTEKILLLLNISYLCLKYSDFYTVNTGGCFKHKRKILKLRIQFFSVCAPLSRIEQGAYSGIDTGEYLFQIVANNKIVM